MNRYKEILSELESGNSLSEDISAVTDRGRKIRKKRRHMGAACIAAAAILTTSVTAAAAAYNWDIRAITEAWFGGKTEYISDNMFEVTVLNEKNRFDDLVFEPKGAVYDENVLIVFMDITRTDGGIFDCTPYTPLFEDGTPYEGDLELVPGHYFRDIHVYRTDSFTEDGTTYMWDVPFRTGECVVADDDPSDGRLTMAFCISAENMEKGTNEIHMEFGRLEEARDTVDHVDVRNWVYTNQNITEVMFGTWSGDVTFEPEPCSTKRIAPYEKAEVNITHQHEGFDKHEFTVTELSVSQISLNLKLESELADEMLFFTPLWIGEIIMKDGSVYKIYQSSSEDHAIVSESGNIIWSGVERPDKWRVNVTYMLREPIDPNDVSAVKIGNTVFEL